MQSVKKWTIAIALAAGPLMAHAQTYDLDITMTGVEGLPSTTFFGSFTFNSHGTCSTSFGCPSGSTPDLTHVKISDPLSGGAFTGLSYAYSAGTGELNFTDFLGNPITSSSVYTLQFSIDAPLGGSAKNIGLNDIAFSTDQNVTGTWSCGGPTQLPTEGVGCSVTSLTRAPEIDPASAAGGLSLLLGSLMVLRGRRPRLADQTSKIR